MTELRLKADLPVPVETAWAALVDWSRQDEWIVGTKVRVTKGDGASVGSELAAFTGVGPLGITDTMHITEWSPPHRCVVRHTGRVIRGSGIFEIYPRGRHGSTIAWSEALDLPFGVLGQASWPLVRPVIAAGVRYSLAHFADFAKGYRR